MEENKKVIVAGAAVICLVVLAAIVYYFFIYGKSPEKPVANTAQVEKAGEKIQGDLSPTEENIETIQVALDKSDDVVRNLGRSLSDHAQYAKWLTSRGLIRRVVASVDNIANGESPRAHFDFFKTDQKFKILIKDDKTFIDPASYNRYNTAADVFNSLDTTGCMSLYRQLKPAFQEAYKELGYPQKDFQETLQKAISNLLAVPVVEGNIEVRKKILSYAFVDSELEKMSEAQKHLFRMGPENIKIIQDKLKDFAAALKGSPSVGE